MNARRGEVRAARAVQAAGVPFCLSTVWACPLNEVAAAVADPFWFELSMTRDPGFMHDLLKQARTHGCSALVFTVEMPLPGARYRDTRRALAGAGGRVGALHRAWQAIQRPHGASNVGMRGRPNGLGNVGPVLGRKDGTRGFLRLDARQFQFRRVLPRSRMGSKRMAGPLIVKDVLDPADTLRAARLSADGGVVSNHGGRQLDGVPSTVHALPSIADAVGERLTVLADGGVRLGLDIVRMLALGARGVLIGRVWAYALADAGGAGISHVLRMIEAEMRVAMALGGATRIDRITRDILMDIA